MGATAAQTTDVAGVLHGLIDSVEGLRVYPYVADGVRVPAAVIGQPSIDFADTSGGFCRAVWLFPVTLITARSSERAAQAEMSKLLLDVVTAVGQDVPESTWVLSVEPLDARPLPGVAVNGQELPAYQLNIRIRA
jgi:hypothetical protein